MKTFKGKIMAIYRRISLLSAFLSAGAISFMLLVSAGPVFSRQSSDHLENNPNNKITARLDDGHGAYVTGHYPNLFKEIGHTRKKINAKIHAAFQQLFYGKPRQRIYFSAGKNTNGPLAYITDVAHHDVRSEGVSYGMMIAVQLNKRDIFDSLWNWAMTYMYIKSREQPAQGYFRWSMKTDGSPNVETPAPDGEEYFVMALYFAAHRWGNGRGIYNYRHWADRVLRAIRHHPLKTGETKFGKRTTPNMVNEQKKMIRIVSGFNSDNFTNPSYQLPAFYDLWARWGPKQDRQFWAEAADASRTFFQNTTNRETGLAPNYANFDGSPRVIKGYKYSRIFSFDAWRAQRNWAVDWSWWQKDPRERKLSNKIQSFFASQGIFKYGDQYTLSGKELDSHHRVGLISTNAVASLAATRAQASQFVKALWNAPIPQKRVTRYYDGLLYTMSLLYCSGKYRIWKP